MFRTLLVPLDHSALAEQALGPAAAIARASGASIELVLVHEPLVFDGFVTESWTAARWQDEDKYLQAITEELASGAGVTSSHSVIEIGPPISAICDYARESKADLIVMTSHGRTGWSRTWLGSVTDGIIRHSAVPVLMMRAVEGKTARIAAHRAFKHILIPLDGSASAFEVVDAAASLGACSHASITLLSVVRPVPMPIVDVDMALTFAYPPVAVDDAATKGVAEDAQRQLADTAQVLARKHGCAIDAHVLIAPHVSQAIVDFAVEHSMDVIAMSTHGRGASRLLVGSVADKVVRASRLPVLLYRPVGARAHMGTEPVHHEAVTIPA